MKKLIAITAGLLFLGVASPAQASDTCNTVVVSLCTGDSGLTLSVPNPNNPTPAEPSTQSQAATPAPAVSAPQEAPGPVATAPKPTKTNTTLPDKKSTPEAQPSPAAPTSQPSTPTAQPATKTKVVTKYVKTPAKWKIPVIVVIALMTLAVTVMYVMYRIGWREAEIKFNEYILEILRSARRRRKRKSPLAVDSSAELS